MELANLLKGRRSIRKFKPEVPSKDLINEILNTALWAPSSMNTQNWEIYVVGGAVRDKIIKAVANARPTIEPALREVVPEKHIPGVMKFFNGLGGAPLIILVYYPKVNLDVSASMTIEERFDVERFRYTSIMSAAALTQNILLTAYEKGLGTCWMTEPKRAEAEIDQILGIEGKELAAFIPIGYPDQEPPAPPRKKDKIHWVG